MIVFQNPSALVLFAVFFAFAYAISFLKRRGGGLPFSLKAWKGTGFRPLTGMTAFFVRFLSFCLWAGASCLVAALSEPCLVTRLRDYSIRGSDVLFVIDQSPSMSVRDFPSGNRFDAAKDVIARFVRSPQNQAVGLVGFGTDAALRVPPTLDFEFVLETLDSLRIMELGSGTAIGTGLAVACLHLERSTAPTKLIVLLTDGVQNAGMVQPESAARIAARMGIRIHVVGLGSEGFTTLEVTDPETGVSYRGSYLSSYDETILRRIAEETGGLFSRASSPEGLDAVFRDLIAMGNPEANARTRQALVSLHDELLFAGFALMCFGFLLKKLFFRELI